MIKRNPKQEGSQLHDCRPQVGECPNQCNQCFYNRKDAFYNDIDQPSVPCPEDIGDGIVRLNCGHDSNIERELVIETAKMYKNFFFNTSIPNLDFPGPVVLTANPKEEEKVFVPIDRDNDKKYTKYLPSSCYDGLGLGTLMFARLRVSPTNLDYIGEAVRAWSYRQHVVVVLTFMAYYDQDPPGCEKFDPFDEITRLRLVDRSEFQDTAYDWNVRHINSYYCATEGFMQYVTKKMKKIGGRLVTRCGTTGSRYCKDCMNCANYYWLTKKHMKEIS